MKPKSSQPHSIPNRRLRCNLIAVALTTCAWSASSAFAADSAVIFGDSLSDGGTFDSRFTTNPGQTAAEYIAAQEGAPTTTWVQGGSNFAQGGARVNSDSADPPDAPQRPISTQVAQYLAQNGGTANPSTLYLIQGGANDIFQNLEAVGGGTMTIDQLQAATYQSGVDFATQVAKLQQAGAKTIVVQNLPNIGLAPEFVGTANAATVTALAQAYNNVVASALSQMGVKAVVLDDYTLIGEVAANPSAYGFTNATEVACTTSSSLDCTAATLVSPNAASTYVFADGVHPTTGAQKLLAQYALATLNAPAQIGLLGTAAINGGVARADRLWTYTADGVKTDRRDWRVFGDLGRGRSEYDDTTHIYHNDFLIGADKAIDGANNRLGVSMAHQRYSGNFKLNETSLGVHWTHQLGTVGAVLVQANYARLNADDINRSIVLGAATRNEAGSTDGNHLSVSAQAAVTVGRFDHDRFSHGLIGRIGYDRVSLNGYDETGGDSSAMHFGKQHREGVLASIGYQIQTERGQFQPYTKLSYDIDNTNSGDLSARLKSATVDFATPIPAGENQTHLTIGTRVRLSPNMLLNLDAQRAFDTAAGRGTTLHLGLSAAF